MCQSDGAAHGQSVSPLSFEATQRPILLFSEAISYCHIVRPLIIARWIRSLDHPVVVACPPHAASLFRSEGCEVVHIETADPSELYRRMAQGSFLYSENDLLDYYRKDEQLLSQVRPQLVISDFRFTILHLSKVKNIPGVSLTSASCHPYFQLSRTTPNPFIKPAWLGPAIFDFLHNTWVGELIKRRVARSISANYASASRRLGLQPVGSFFDYASQGELCLLCDHPDVMPLPRLRPQDQYTGMLVWYRDEPLPPEIRNLDESTRKIYISIGTQDALDIPFLKPLAERLSEEGYTIIISKGKRQVTIPVRGKNVYVVDFVNESKLLPMIDLYIYHGSAMSTYQGLAAGKPMIAIPAQADQHFHAESLVRLGVGAIVRPVELNVEKMIAMVGTMLRDERLLQRANDISQELLKYDQRTEIVRKIANLIGRNRVRSRNP